MCTDRSRTQPSRQGSRLEHGEAHLKQHAQWTRRQFMQALGVATVGGSFLFQQTAMTAFGKSSLLESLRQVDTDRVLVLLQMDGGNDGLNTLVPTSHDTYYRLRPNLSIAKSSTLALTPDRGLNTALSDLYPFFGDGRLGIVEGVGYPSPNLSHFRSTDIWMSATDGDTYVSTGWAGRSMETMFPAFGDAPSPFPLGVQLGGSSFLFNGNGFNTGMSISSPEAFERLAGKGTAFGYEGIPATSAGAEMRYARQVINDSYRYATAIQDAAGRATNQVTYPDSALASDLAIVSRLIKGELGARIYVVSIGGFDTHAEQEPMHTQLLSRIGGALKAFVADLEEADLMDRVLVMSFSEFGRSVYENGSFGTDHSTAAPLFLLGNAVRGGLHGALPDLENTDAFGDPLFTVDFRAVYESVLQNWFGLEASATTSILGGAFTPIDLFDTVPTDTDPNPAAPSARLEQNFPNPASSVTTIRYELTRPSAVRLDVFDTRGRQVMALVDASLPVGRYEVPVTTQGLPAGQYFYRLTSGAGVQTRSMTVVR